MALNLRSAPPPAGGFSHFASGAGEQAKAIASSLLEAWFDPAGAEGDKGQDRKRPVQIAMANPVQRIGEAVSYPRGTGIVFTFQDENRKGDMIQMDDSVAAAAVRL